MYISWWLRWVWKFYILRENYGDEEKLYLIKKYMKANKSQWEVSMSVLMVLSNMLRNVLLKPLVFFKALF